TLLTTLTHTHTLSRAAVGSPLRVSTSSFSSFFAIITGAVGMMPVTPPTPPLPSQPPSLPFLFTLHTHTHTPTHTHTHTHTCNCLIFLHCILSPRLIITNQILASKHLCNKAISGMM